MLKNFDTNTDDNDNGGKDDSVVAESFDATPWEII